MDVGWVSLTRGGLTSLLACPLGLFLAAPSLLTHADLIVSYSRYSPPTRRLESSKSPGPPRRILCSVPSCL